MKPFLVFLFFLNTLLFAGCASKEPEPLNQEAAKEFTRWTPAFSWTVQTEMIQTGSSTQTGSGNSPQAPKPASLSWAVLKTFPIPKKDEEDVWSVLLTSFSECSDPEYPENVRAFFVKLRVPEGVKKRSDELIVNRCEIRATLRETGKCDGLPKEILGDCENLKSAISLLNSKEEKKSPEYFAARALYQTYFLDLEKFPPSEFVKTGTEVVK